ncbi:MAG TPA: helix-turn-helix transcriptional regulator [Jiangellaceae bacterium]|nr:helix-turn-helix transcriptional regulator [Jiangellaceae bacterium]
MILRDRKRLATIMAVQNVSHRKLAEAAGWRAHSYLGRLLRGEVKTLDVEPAVRIAKYLGVGTDDLFLARTSDETGRSDQRRGAA